MAKCKTKTFQTDLDIFKHIQNLVWVTQNLPYSEPEVYSEPWYIQNLGIFRVLVYSELKACLCQPSRVERFANIVNSYNHFHKF